MALTLLSTSNVDYLASKKLVPSLKVLQESGIEIEEDLRHIQPLPPYAEDLRKLLLNFTQIIPRNTVWPASSGLEIPADRLDSPTSRNYF